MDVQAPSRRSGDLVLARVEHVGVQAIWKMRRVALYPGGLVVGAVGTAMRRTSSRAISREGLALICSLPVGSSAISRQRMSVRMP